MRSGPSAHRFNGEAHATAVLVIAFVPTKYHAISIQIAHILYDGRMDGTMSAMLVTAATATVADFEIPKWHSLS